MNLRLLILFFSLSFLSFELFSMKRSNEDISDSRQACASEDDKTLESQWNDFSKKFDSKDIFLVDIDSILNNVKFLEYADRNYQFTPLHFAVISKPEKILDYLGRGILIESKDKYGRTPLYKAAQFNPESVKILIASGADKEAKDMYGQTPFHMAARFNPESVKVLIASGADKEAKDKYGQTPLHMAARFNPESVKVLMESGANKEANALHGVTPLHMAARFNPESVKVLIAVGVDKEAKMVYGRTPLHVAAQYNPESVKVLIASGADKEAKMVDGRTPLHVAAKYNPESVKVLIASGADKEAKEEKGWTPLHVAACFNSKSVEMLLKNILDRANIESTTVTEETPLHIAVRMCNVQTLKILLEKGANPNAVNISQLTPLQLFRAGLNNMREQDRTKLCLPIIRVFFKYISNKDLEYSLSSKILNTLQDIRRVLRSENGILSFNQSMLDAGFKIDQDNHDISAKSYQLNDLFNLLRFNNFKTIGEIHLNLQHGLKINSELMSKLSLTFSIASMCLSNSEEKDEDKKLLSVKEIVSPVIYNEVVNLIKNGVPLNIIDIDEKRLIDYALEAGDIKLFGLLASVGVKFDYISVMKLIKRSHFGLLKELIQKINLS